MNNNKKVKPSNYRFIIVVFIFLLGFSLRLVFAPLENESADPFELLTAAKNLSDTGKYLVPGIGTADLKIHYTFPGWPVGFPLMLSIIFKILGYNEFYARVFVILLGSLTIICTFVITAQLYNQRIAYMAALLMASHPLVVAFNGRIFTNNPSLFFLTFSIMSLLLSTVRRAEFLKFITPDGILSENLRLISFAVAFYSLGFLITIRDTEAVFLPVYAYILYRAGFFAYADRRNLRYGLKLLLLAGLAFIVGYLPSIYYNYQNYGIIITSATYQWGGRLDYNYLLFGGNSYLGLPGALVILLSVIVYCFPLLLLIFRKNYSNKDRFLVIIFMLMLIPIILINGSYPVASTGAAPRYILPLIPLFCILAASLHSLSIKSPPKRLMIYFIFIVWLGFLTYPVPALFKLSPKMAYAAHYAPGYQIYPYKNYPSHVNSISNWIKDKTPQNSIVIASSANPYPFYYYAQRDVITYPNINQAVIRNLTKQRPIYLVEDHEATYNPTAVDKIKKAFRDSGFDYVSVHAIELFSPKIGVTAMHIYKIVEVP
jgi:4-amino-4-deoxy-L-arabinose transferase-like glycosyltransferase